MPSTTTAEFILSDSDDDFVMMNNGGDDSDFSFDECDNENIAPKQSRSSKVSNANAKVSKVKVKAKSTAKPKAVKKNTTVKPKVKKTATKSKSKTSAKKKTISDDGQSLPVLSERSINVNVNVNDDSDDDSDDMKELSNAETKTDNKTVEERYQKLTQLEHILVRPDTYVGSVEPLSQEMYVLEGENIVNKHITYTPGLYKIYDEILVNAADNKQRDSNMDKLDITFNAEDNTIIVKNNGKGIPVEFHKDEKCYVPTLVFGHLLTGSNFDDDEKKTTGGRNGYGAKLANIFSTKFIVECADTNNGKKFIQVFRHNMTVCDGPIITSLTATEKKRGDYVQITFSPDLARFNMTKLDDDIISLFSKRAYDIAGSMARCKGKTLAVSLNGNKIPVKKFEQYLKLYADIDPPVAYEDDGDRWEVGVGISDGSFKQVSFVNSINTSKGGEHVNAIATMVAKKLILKLKKKKKDLKITESQIKNHLCIFVNCLIENPSFDSQTKDCLTTRKSNFGSKCELSDKFLNKIEKSEIIEKILSFAVFKERQQLGKKSGKKRIKLTGIAKLDDANFAGSAKSKDCTLILTEGDSAKSLAMSGLSVVGRDYYGCFPLKGKPLNVREASITQVMNNDEIKNIIEIMGLKFDVKYDESNIKTLRYRHLMIMADQDHDGSHIKGLIINFFHHYWPSLLDVPGFLQQFITPIVKATKGKQSKTFFTLPEYENWKASTGDDAKGWRIKYYKGLGTSTSAEAKDYFSNLDLHEISFNDLASDECRIVSLTIDNNCDLDSSMSMTDAIPDVVKSGSDMIELAFSKKKVEDRKGWLNNLKKDTYLDYSASQSRGVNYSDFINKELILFSQADNIRSLPNLFDGFKPSQRKVLFGCFLKNLKNEMKVAQLCGYIGEKSAYHHGEASMQGTIVNMAQDFVGSNNINLLTPSGQFGTRRMGGKDSASPRYIFTKLEKITRAIFHPDDDALLHYLHDDGESIEPEFYMPIIPMILVNGADGIGTGWSTSIPNFNPRELISNILKKMNGEAMDKMQPHYFGFGGTIESNSAVSYTVSGRIERLDDETVFIDELPIKSWTQDYKVFLEKMMLGDEKKKIDPEIKDFTENHTDTTVSFTITSTKALLDKFEKEKDGLEGKFKLISKISTSNMNVFDQHGRIVKYSSPEALLDYFYDERLRFYGLRKDHLLDQLRRDQRMLSNKARFIEEVCSGVLIVSNRKRAAILANLQDSDYELFSKNSNKTGTGDEENDEDEQNDDSSDADLAKGYEYLLGMKIWSLTFEKAEKMRNELAEKTKTVQELEATSPTELWKKDLKVLEEALDERNVAYAAAADEELKAQNKNKKHQATKRKPIKRQKAAVRPKTETNVKPDVDSVVVSTATASLASSKPKAKAKAKPGQSKAKSSGNPSKKKDIVATAKPVKQEDIVELDCDSDSDVEESMSLFDRMRKKTTAPSSSSSSYATAPRNNSKKRSSPKSDNSEDLESFDMSTYEPAALTPAPKKTRVNKMKPMQKKDVKAETIKASKRRVDSFVEEEESSEDDDYVPPPPRSRPTRGRKAVQYDDAFDEDEDSGDDDAFDEDEDSGDDDAFDEDEDSGDDDAFDEDEDSGDDDDDDDDFNFE